MRRPLLALCLILAAMAWAPRASHAQRRYVYGTLDTRTNEFRPGGRLRTGLRWVTTPIRGAWWLAKAPVRAFGRGYYGFVYGGGHVSRETARVFRTAGKWGFGAAGIVGGFAAGGPIGAVVGGLAGMVLGWTVPHVVGRVAGFVVGAPLKGGAAFVRGALDLPEPVPQGAQYPYGAHGHYGQAAAAQ
jgi:hypothetical protein